MLEPTLLKGGLMRRRMKMKTIARHYPQGLPGRLPRYVMKRSPLLLVSPGKPGYFFGGEMPRLGCHEAVASVTLRLCVALDFDQRPNYRSALEVAAS